MSFLSDIFKKKGPEDPEKQLKKVKKYYMEVLGITEEEAEEKARERLFMPPTDKP